MITYIIMNWWGKCHGPFPTEEDADSYAYNVLKWKDWDVYEVKAPKEKKK